MAIHFINTTREEFLNDYKRVYRLTTLDRFIEGLKTKKFAFIKPIEWTDPFEKIFLDREFIIDGEKIKLPMNENLFAVCLSGTSDSEANWKVYAPKEDGIRLTFDTTKLLTNFIEKIPNADIFIGHVNYQNTREFHSISLDKKALIDEIKRSKIGEQQIELMLKKRKTFLYEDEIRIMIIPHKKSKSSSIFHTPADITAFTLDYTLDPRIGNNHAKILKDYFQRAFELKLSHSKLYSNIKREAIYLS